jgi:hypothetical protein
MQPRRRVGFQSVRWVLSAGCERPQPNFLSFQQLPKSLQRSELVFHIPITESIGSMGTRLLIEGQRQTEIPIRSDKRTLVGR